MGERDRWHVDHLSVENFRCFSSLSIDFDPSLTVLVGVNGSGKTAILDALAVMLSTILRQFEGPTKGFSKSDVRTLPVDLRSQESVARMEPQYPVAAELSATVAGQSVRWQRERASFRGRTSWADKNTTVGQVASDVWRGANQEPSVSQTLPIIALYGVERLLGVRKAAGSIPQSRAGAYESALDGKSDIARLSSYIKLLSYAEFAAERRGSDAEAARRQLLAIKIACNGILEGTGWADPEWNPVSNEISLTHTELGTLPLSYLSSGLKISVGLVLDLASRIARANPHLGAHELLTSARGVVLIDEVDLHLHPSWQQRIVPQLRSLFPGLQFVVTTHSPQVLSTVAARHIRIVEADRVRHVDFSGGLRSDVVLDRILGTDPEPALPVNDELARYTSLVSQGLGSSPEAREIRRRLDDELGGVEYVRKLAEADAVMTFFDIADDMNAGADASDH